ncbi:hypothetical protein [Herbaspirillum rubrisubalbicans]|uniref:Uncharacterized protein n=1 Tax=Herbaspirillum rubrisubalbicans TaxID=80842 RepID=A0AAD0UBQ4_9BURK|nr:hypothetical protein [Herbaspirillum rubrisubalbicans]AYR25846.1 hypothetical protein RC54_19375 [Herbaspirillum rubrisubalbicans]
MSADEEKQPKPLVDPSLDAIYGALLHTASFLEHLALELEDIELACKTANGAPLQRQAAALLEKLRRMG